MARMPIFLRGRIGTEPLGNNTHNVRIDGVVMGQVRRMPGGRWIWTEHPHTLWESREEAITALARDKVDRGLVRPLPERRTETSLLRSGEWSLIGTRGSVSTA